MKQIITILLAIAMATNILAQATPPQAFNYSAVARSADNSILAKKSIGIQFSILKGSSTGTVIYQENHFTNTNAFGLFNLMIGEGTVQSGVFANIDWSSDNYYIQVGIDITGNTNFVTMSTTQMVSVPYALYAKSAGSVSGGGSTVNNGFVVRFNGTPISDPSINDVMIGDDQAQICTILTDSNYRFQLQYGNNTILYNEINDVFTDDTINFTNLYLNTDIGYNTSGKIFSITNVRNLSTNTYYIPLTASAINVPAYLYFWDAYNWTYQTTTNNYINYYRLLLNNPTVTGFNLTFPVNVTIQRN